MKELVEAIAKALVDNPEEVRVNAIEGEQSTMIELSVGPSDLGKVIGRQGRTANAIRVILGAAGMTDDKTLELAGDNARNLYGVINLALADDKCPGMLKMKERMEKYQHGEDIFMYTTYGYTAMEILKEGLRLAGKDLTRENLVKALEKLRDFDAEGLMSPISYGPNNRSSGRAAFIVKADVKTKKWVRASDWIMP